MNNRPIAATVRMTPNPPSSHRTSVGFPHINLSPLAFALLPVTVALFVSGCAQVPLAVVQAQPGKTADQEQADVDYCRKIAMRSGTEASIKQAFVDCMGSLGYGARLPTTTDLSAPHEAALTTMAGLLMDWPPGFKAEYLSDDTRRRTKILLSGYSEQAKISVLVQAAKHAEGHDGQSFASSMRAFHLHNFPDATATEIQELQILGRKAYQYELTASVSGIQGASMITTIEGAEMLVYVQVSTPAMRFAANADLMSQIPLRISRIQ